MGEVVDEKKIAPLERMGLFVCAYRRLLKK